MPAPDTRLRRALLLATWVFVALELAWLALWLWLTRHFDNLGALATPPVIAYLSLGGLSPAISTVLAHVFPRAAGFGLTGAGFGTAVTIWLGHVPSYGAPEALWCTSLTMVALGAAWLALAKAQPMRG